MGRIALTAALLALWLAATPPASARSQRGKDGLWVAKNRTGSESFGFSLRRHGRRIVRFDGGLSPAARSACYGRLNFGRIRVSRSGRFRDRLTSADGTQIGKIRGRFTSRRRAVFYVRRIEAPPGLPPCDSGPVRFSAKFIV